MSNGSENARRLTPVAPAISVVVPAYRAERTLRATLTSLLAQTLRDIEILVVNDGSDDGTVDICREFVALDPRVRLLSQKNRGLAGARNTGIRMARADLIGFCDADDIWAPDKAARHVAFMATRRDVGLSFSGTVVIDDAGRPLGMVQRPNPADVSMQVLLRSNPIGNGSTAVMRRACLDDMMFPGAPSAGRRSCWFDESYRQSEDIELWSRVQASSWKIAGLSAPLTGYRVRSDGKSLSSNVDGQIGSWLRMFGNLSSDAGVDRNAALASQWRWQARKAVFAGDGEGAVHAMSQAMCIAPGLMATEFAKTAQTMVAAVVLAGGGRFAHRLLIGGLRRRPVPEDAGWVLAYVGDVGVESVPA